MNVVKKLAGKAVQVVCVAGLAGAVVASAESSVSLYGRADAWVGSSRPIGQANRDTLMGSGGMQTSYWGIRGNEELGGGLNAIFALEAFFRMNTGEGGRYQGDALYARSAYVGFESPFGSVTVGRNTTPYWMSTAIFNPFSGSFAFSPTIFHSYGPNGSVAAPLVGDSGWDNSILYTTPSMAGLKASVLYARGEESEDADGGKNKFGANLLYTSGPFAATLAFQDVDFSSTPGDLGAGFKKQRALFAGVTYDFDVVKVFGNYQRLNNDLRSGAIRTNGGQAGVSIPLGSGSVLASYAYAKTSDGPGSKRNTWAVGYDYDVSKRTGIYIGYFHDKVSGVGSGDTFGVGIRHGF